MIRLLREFIRESVSFPYETALEDDPGFKGKSTLVPDEYKERIKIWMKAMGLASPERKKRNKR